VVKEVSFAEAKEIEVPYYASVGWKESAAVVEEMRKGIWAEEYKKEMEKVVSRGHLKEDRDDIE
jgi:16S rRNA U516 pseudouridylate synthase RsuA-like enzyme